MSIKRTKEAHRNVDFTYDPTEHSARHPMKVKVSGVTHSSIIETVNIGVGLIHSTEITLIVLYY